MLSPWTINDAVDMVKELRPLIKDLGYFVTIGGGVLERGSSQNDLDLFLLPLRSDKIEKNPAGVVELLQKLWGYYRNLRVDYEEAPRNRPIPPPRVREADDDLDEDREPEDLPAYGLPAEKRTVSIYSHAMSFTRNGDDKIDVFIVGGQ